MCYFSLARKVSRGRGVSCDVLWVDGLFEYLAAIPLFTVYTGFPPLPGPPL